MNFDMNSIVRRAAYYLNHLAPRRKVIPAHTTPKTQADHSHSVEPTALTPLQLAVLKIITEEIHDCSSCLDFEFSRYYAVNLLIHTLYGFRGLPFEALEGAIDDLVEAGCLLESAEGILSLPHLGLVS